jgi:hypothetical protein
MCSVTTTVLLIKTPSLPFTSLWRPVSLSYRSSCYFMFASIEFLLLNKPRSLP